MHPIVAIDFETANPFRGSACSVGMVKINEKGVPIEELHSLIRPHPSVDTFSPYNVHVHGITPNDVVDAPEWSDIINDVLGFIENLPLVAHNASFEKSVLTKLSNLYGMPMMDNSIFCTLKMSKDCLSLDSYALPKVYEHLFLELGGNQHHDALDDAMMSGEVYCKLVQHYYAQAEDISQSSVKKVQWKPRQVKVPTRLFPVDAEPQPRPSIEEILNKYGEHLSLWGRNVCATGTMNHLTRDEFHRLVKKLGGTPSGSVSSRADILVFGEMPSTTIVEGRSAKLNRAYELYQEGCDISIMTEQEFLETFLPIGASRDILMDK